jgi:hypothetical protein
VDVRRNAGVKRPSGILKRGFTRRTEACTAGYAARSDSTKNARYNEKLLSTKSGSYKERGEILSADVARKCA